MIYDSRVHFLVLEALSLKEKLESDEVHNFIAYMKPILINATDRAVVNTDNYQFYFNKLLTLKKIKIQNDVLTKEKINANWKKYAGCISGGLSALLMIHNRIKPDTTVRTASHVAAHASHMINRTGTFLNFAYGEDGDSLVYNHESSSPSYHAYEQDRASSVFSKTRSVTRQQIIQVEYIDEDTEALNKKGRDDLKDFYKNNQKFKNEIMNFVRDETELSDKNILDKKFKHNSLNKLGMETLAKFAFS